MCCSCRTPLEHRVSGQIPEDFLDRQSCHLHRRQFYFFLSDLVPFAPLLPPCTQQNLCCAG